MSGRMNSDPDAAEERNSPAAPHASTHDGGAQMPANPNDESFLLATLRSIHGTMERLDERVERLDGKVEHAQASISEVKGELLQHEMTLQQVLKQQLQTNGNVSRNSDRLDRIEARHDHDDGFSAGRKAERDRMYAVARIASKPVTWAVGGVIGAVGYIVKDRAG